MVIFSNFIPQERYEKRIGSIERFKDKPIIIKGCANKPIPSSAFAMLIQKLHPIAKTIMYGEACSTVPISKRKK